jgi:hypothetical protein
MSNRKAISRGRRGSGVQRGPNVVKPSRGYKKPTKNIFEAYNTGAPFIAEGVAINDVKRFYDDNNIASAGLSLKDIALGLRHNPNFPAQLDAALESGIRINAARGALVRSSMNRKRKS